MKWLTAFLAVTLLAACSSSGGTTQDPGTGPAVESLVSTELPVGNANCPAGGHFFTFNDGKTAYVCNGLNGAKGEKGDTGLQGLKGDIGLQGLKGDTGSQGIQGLQGIAGPPGPNAAFKSRSFSYDWSVINANVNIGSIEVTAPSAGHFLVEATGFCRLTSSAATLPELDLSLTTTATGSGVVTALWFTATSVGEYQGMPIAGRQVFPAIAGPNTFYFNGRCIAAASCSCAGLLTATFSASLLQ